MLCFDVFLVDGNDGGLFFERVAVTSAKLETDFPPTFDMNVKAVVVGTDDKITIAVAVAIVLQPITEFIFGCRYQ